MTRSELDADLARRHPLRILLAEDNVVNQKVALRLLGQMGYRADVAANGLEAIDAVARQTYDVVLMDVQMPELDGFEASREINRRWPGERHPRIVAMTANALQGDRELCAAAGMDDYVAKPIRVEELVGALERCRWRPEVGAPAAPARGTHRPDPNPSLPARPQDRERGHRARRAPKARRRPRSSIDRRSSGITATMGGAFVAELIDTFGEDARELIGTLRRALAETDVDTFRRAAHSLKSTGETVGATGLAALARELESMARAGRLDGADRPARAAHRLVRDRHAARWRSSDVTSPRNAQAGDLLVVDDNRVNRLLLGRALEQLGHTVTFAENGREALEVLRQRRVDLVLLDIEMPEMDGYQVLEALDIRPAPP